MVEKRGSRALVGEMSSDERRKVKTKVRASRQHQQRNGV